MKKNIYRFLLLSVIINICSSNLFASQNNGPGSITCGQILECRLGVPGFRGGNPAIVSKSHILTPYQINPYFNQVNQINSNLNNGLFFRGPAQLRPQPSISNIGRKPAIITPQENVGFDFETNVIH